MNDDKNESGITGKFSVALGLFDYINPVLYSITVITLMKNMHGKMNTAVFCIFAAGAVLSLVFGLAIPTVKLLVGLGKMEFKMPVNLVSFVNTGILLSGISLAGYVLGITAVGSLIVLLVTAAVLLIMWRITGKFNTVAVLIGAAGYIMIYASLISLSVRKGMLIPIILCAFAICFFVSLCLVGIKADLKNARVHWALEISNVTCQLLVALATLVLFLG